ncbi:MAG TPA: hypothetical protein VHK27_07105 [Gammaproteobacteria bacterium]|nr:hypothetical protein [Gammaproteobacteria bacterium]
MSFDNAYKDKLHSKIVEIQELTVRHAKWRTCLNCVHWQGNEGIPKQCELFKAMPPPEVIVHGCREWEDSIPF